MNTVDVRGDQQVIGISLSKCIQAVANGHIQPAQIVRIVTDRVIEDEKKWRTLIAQLRVLYWKANPNLAEKTVRELLAAGRIDMPAADGGNVPDKTYGIWVLGKSDIVWRRAAA